MSRSDRKWDILSSRNDCGEWNPTVNSCYSDAGGSNKNANFNSFGGLLHCSFADVHQR